MESIWIKDLYSTKTKCLLITVLDTFHVLLRVCVLGDGYFIRFLYPGWCRWTDKDVIKLLVLDLFIHALQTTGFRDMGRVVVFPPGIPGKRGSLGECRQVRSAGQACIRPTG